MGTFQPTGRIIVYGQAGDDDIQVAGSITLPAWLFGGDGNDRLNGQAGNDKIDGGTGNDTISGGQGLDTIDGGDGGDVIFGGADNDVLRGGGGDDLMFGGAGLNRVFGEAGNDTLVSASLAAAYGTTGDQLYGGDGNDLLRGGAGNDNLFGGAGNNRLFGGGGWDYLQTTPGLGKDIFGLSMSTTSSPTIDGFSQTDGDLLQVKFTDFGLPVQSATSAIAGASVLVGGGTGIAVVTYSSTPNAAGSYDIASIAATADAVVNPTVNTILQNMFTANHAQFLISGYDLYFDPDGTGPLVEHVVARIDAMSNGQLTVLSPQDFLFVNA